MDRRRKYENSEFTWSDSSDYLLTLSGRHVDTRLSNLCHKCQQLSKYLSVQNNDDNSGFELRTAPRKRTIVNFMPL